MFDVAAVRTSLEGRRKALDAELAQVERLQRKFAGIHSTLAHPAAQQQQQTKQQDHRTSLAAAPARGSTGVAVAALADNLASMSVKNAENPMGKGLRGSVDNLGENGSMRASAARPPLASMR